MSVSKEAALLLECIVKEKAKVFTTASLTALVAAALILALAAGSDVLGAVRIGWTVLTFIGTVRVVLNLREALLDLHAVIESKRNGVRLIQSRGAVFDQGLKSIALGADCLAGVMSIAGLLTATVVMLCVSALMLVNLSFSQERRRKQTLFLLDTIYKTQLDSIQETGQDTNEQVSAIRAKTVATDTKNDARMQAIEDRASAVAETQAEKDQAQE